MGKKYNLRLTEQDLIDMISKQVTGKNAADIIKDYVGKILNPKSSTSTDSTDKIKDNPSMLGDKESDIKSITTTDDDFYKEVLSCVGAKPTKDNMSFMYAWRQAEGGKATNNPFNTTQKMAGATNYNSVGVKNYQTQGDGIQSTCKTLKNGRYNDIIDGLKNDVGLFELSRMKGLKTWGTGDLLAKVADGYLKGSSPKPPYIA
jgi:hypothetical protein